MTTKKSIWCPQCTKKHIKFISFKASGGKWILTSEKCKCKYVFPIVRGNTEKEVFEKGEELRKRELKRFIYGAKGKK